MTTLPTLRQIQFLIALKETGSFSKAAALSHVTQSTLSAGIQEMEIILGAPVIDRANRRILRFTPLGQDILAQGRTSINALTDIAERSRRLQKPLSWPLRVGIIPTIAPYLLPQILRPLQKSFPTLKLNIHEVQSTQLVEQVHNGTLDFGVMAFPFDTKDLMQMPLVAEKFFCAVPAKQFKDKTKITIPEIEAQKLLLLSDGHCLRDHALAACNMKQISQLQDVSATSLSTLIQLVSHGYGVTLLPEMVVQDGSLKDIKILPIAPKAPTRTIGIVWRKNAPLQDDITLIAKAIFKLMKK